jgi:putative transposase
MKYDPDKHHRRSICLKGFNYSSPGTYFITICAQHRECLFGEIVNGTIHLNPAGEMAMHWWLELNQKFPSIQTDPFVVMPNHFHGIIVIPATSPDHLVGADRRVCPLQNVTPPQLQNITSPNPIPQNVTPPNPTIRSINPPCPMSHDEYVDDDATTLEEGAHIGAPLRVNETSLNMGVSVSRMVQWFKTMTTNAYIRGVKEQDWQPFNKRLWQRNYYEHVIRDKAAFQNIRQYIRNNQKSWTQDQLHPDNPSKW